MIANAIGANVVAIDISEQKLRLASALGAVATVNATQAASVAEAVIEITKGGAHLSLEALGDPSTCFKSISNLRKRGKHIQSRTDACRAQYACHSDEQSSRTNWKYSAATGCRHFASSTMRLMGRFFLVEFLLAALTRSGNRLFLGIKLPTISSNRSFGLSIKP
jgi:Zn-dependent alcohol dehydrogenase